MEKYFELQYKLQIIGFYIIGICFAIPILLIGWAKILCVVDDIKRKIQRRKEQKDYDKHRDTKEN